MRAVMSIVPPDVRLLRKRTGADQWDEMWEGVVHMPPMPNRTHQHLEWALETWLWTHWAEPAGNRVYHEVNLAPPGGWPVDYRIPDLVLLTPECFDIDHDEYFEARADRGHRNPQPRRRDLREASVLRPRRRARNLDHPARHPHARTLRAAWRQLRAASLCRRWLAAQRDHGSPIGAEPNGRLGIQMGSDVKTRRRLPRD